MCVSHPRTFTGPQGDCKHALWAWRKLIELGHPAEFFVGQWLEGGGAHHDCHAWVVFEQDGERFLLEAVDATFTMRSHAGYLLYLKERERRR